MNLPPFHNPALLARAFTHRSYLNEHPDSGEDNERLEFLGDAVLDFVSGSFLYQRYPTMSEGQLTRVRSALVRAERLAALAEKFDLGDQLRMGKGEEETGGRERVSMLGDAFEAVIGALYLDAGLEAVRAFVEPLFAPLAETILQAEHDQDAKSYFQEIAQAEYRHTPRYRTIAAEGPEHERMFTVEVVVGENVFGAGQGRNKNAATQAAARNALERLTPRRLLITGASGYVGGQLMNAARLWTVTGTYFSRPFTPRAGSIATALDLTDFNAARQIMTDARPTAIIHTACSNRGDLSAIISAARNLATLADEQGIRLVHLSTDLVFDGEHAPYPDDAPLRPLMDYGKAKAEAEALVLELCPSAVIVRPSLVWGLNPLDHQTKWLVEGARAGASITLFTDEIRCPTYISDLCAALLELAVKPEITGPMNLTGPQALNRWELGTRLLTALKIAPGPNIGPGTVAASGLIRSRNLTLVAQRAQALLRTRLRGVDEVLAKW